MFGLKSNQIEILNKIFNRFRDINKVFIFGSRLNKSYNQFSDIDLCIMDNIDDKKLNEIQEEIANSDLIYFVDLLVLNRIQNKNLKIKIKQEGKVFWLRNKN